MTNLPPNAIVPTLSLETINPDLYRSKTLWCPTGARGVFGGQVIGQALVAATSTVGEDGKGWSLHSQHCYFILPADPNVPILYAVQRLRDGRSYATRSIVASQNAIPIFHLTCSFSRPSPTPQPAYQDPLPDLRFLFPLTAESSGKHAEASGNFRLPSPDECELEEERWQKILTAQDRPMRAGEKKRTPLSAKARVQLKAYMTERAESPIAIKEIYPLKSATMMTGVEFPTSDPETDNGTARPEQVVGVRARNRRMLWMKLRDGADLEGHGPGFEKCILAYLSDFQFVGTAAQSVGLSHNTNPRLAMMASLDHTVFFYSDSFTTAEWLLHVVDSPRTGGGRGVVTGRFYTQSGELIAVCVQEGVVRAGPRKEEGPGAKPKDAAKL